MTGMQVGLWFNAVFQKSHNFSFFE